MKMAKYSFETTVGEILDTPELVEIFEETCPEILEHPLLEAGRGFKFAEALTYVSELLDDEQLEQIRNKMEAL